MTQLDDSHVMIGGNVFWWLLAISITHNIIRSLRFRSHSFFSNPIFQCAARQCEGGGGWGLWSRGAGRDGFKFKSPALSLLLFRTLVIALWIRLVLLWLVVSCLVFACQHISHPLYKPLQRKASVLARQDQTRHNKHFMLMQFWPL